MSHLVAGPVADPPSPVWLLDEADGKAPFPIYKTNDPAEKLVQPFLLIARTVQIITARTHTKRLRRVPDGYSGFPAYSRMLTALLPVRRAAFYLRHTCYTPSASCNTPARRGWVVSVPPSSPCRHGGRTISSPAKGVWRMASEDSSHRSGRPFLLIVRTERVVTARSRELVAPDTRMSQHIARFCNRPNVDGYSYRRRLPGLSFRASPSEDG